jgi:hypothetical protein
MNNFHMQKKSDNIFKCTFFYRPCTFNVSVMPTTPNHSHTLMRRKSLLDDIFLARPTIFGWKTRLTVKVHFLPHTSSEKRKLIITWANKHFFLLNSVPEQMNIVVGFATQSSLSPAKIWKRIVSLSHESLTRPTTTRKTSWLNWVELQMRVFDVKETNC